MKVLSETLADKNRVTLTMPDACFTDQPMFYLVTEFVTGISGRTLTYSDGDHLLTAGTPTYQYNVNGFLESRTNGTDVTDN